MEMAMNTRLLQYNNVAILGACGTRPSGTIVSSYIYKQYKALIKGVIRRINALLP